MYGAPIGAGSTFQNPEEAAATVEDRQSAATFYGPDPWGLSPLFGEQSEVASPVSFAFFFRFAKAMATASGTGSAH